MSEVHYLDLADYLLIAEAVLETPAEELALAIRVDLAESALAAPAAQFGGVEFYPDFANKVAVLCRRLIKNHALPDGNKRVGFLCAVEFAERNGYRWTPPPDDDPEGAESVRVIEGVAAGELDEQHLAEWVRARLAGS